MKSNAEIMAMVTLEVLDLLDQDEMLVGLEVTNLNSDSPWQVRVSAVPKTEDGS